jgi:asparagine synthetase B (glutamine-hydrolysing)
VKRYAAGCDPTVLFFAELSGGLDSSAIVCLADQLIKKREVQATDWKRFVARL